MEAFLLVMCAASILGYSLLWGMALLNFRRGASRNDYLAAAVNVIGWRVLAASLFGLAAAAGAGGAGLMASLAPEIQKAMPVGNLGIGPMIAASALLVLAGMFFFSGFLIHFLFALYRSRDAELQMFTRLLLLALRKGIPLQSAARAFASERSDSLGIRALDLADALDSGAPLEEAFRKARVSIGWRTLLLHECGRGESGANAARLYDDPTSPAAPKLIQFACNRFTHLAVLFALTNAFVAVTGLHVVPAFQKVMQEFTIVGEYNDEEDAPLPANATASMNPLENPMLLQVMAAVSFVGVCVLFVALIYILGVFMHWVNARAWPLSWLFLSLDAADCCRLLARTTELNRPLDQALELIAQRHPYPSVKERLLNVLVSLRCGVDWKDALTNEGLLSTNEAAMLAGAQRNANLPWALNQIADLREARFARRATRATDALYFPCVLVAAAFVAAYACSMISSLSELVFRFM